MPDYLDVLQEAINVGLKEAKQFGFDTAMALRRLAYSHSMVPGGFEVTS